MSLAERVAERLRLNGRFMHRSELDEVLPALADLVELGDIAIPDSDDICRHDAALRRLAVALGVEKEEG